LKDPTGPNSGADASRKSSEPSLRAHPELESAHEQASTVRQRRWRREVLRRGLFEALNLGANFAIAIFALLWLDRLLSRAPASKTGLFLAVAVVVSIAAYHFARWKASALMSRQVEKFTAWLAATLGMALVWGGICLAFTYGAFRWFSVSGIYSWAIGAITGCCGFAHVVLGEWSDLEDCLALPARDGGVALQESCELHQGQ
jgi:hypothetical protein